MRIGSGDKVNFKIRIPMIRFPKEIRELLKDIEGNKEKIIAMGGLHTKISLEGEMDGKPVVLDAIINFITGEINILTPDVGLKISDAKLIFKE